MFELSPHGNFTPIWKTAIYLHTWSRSIAENIERSRQQDYHYYDGCYYWNPPSLLFLWRSDTFFCFASQTISKPFSISISKPFSISISKPFCFSLGGWCFRRQTIVETCLQFPKIAFLRLDFLFRLYLGLGLNHIFPYKFIGEFRTTFLADELHLCIASTHRTFVCRLQTHYTLQS